MAAISVRCNPSACFVTDYHHSYVLISGVLYNFWICHVMFLLRDAFYFLAWFKQFISKENGLGKAKMRHKPYPTAYFFNGFWLTEYKYDPKCDLMQMSLVTDNLPYRSFVRMLSIQIYHAASLKVQYGLQSMCKQTCKYLVRCTLYISLYLLIFG